jgi:hypothetical protein
MANPAAFGLDSGQEKRAVGDRHDCKQFIWMGDNDIAPAVVMRWQIPAGRDMGR